MAVDDPTVGSAPDDSKALSISVTDVDDDDVINGQGGDDLITPGRGRDIVNAGAGNDTIVATIGDGFFDVYNGGSGTDTIDLSGITAPVTVDLAQFFVLACTRFGRHVLRLDQPASRNP